MSQCSPAELQKIVDRCQLLERNLASNLSDFDTCSRTVREFRIKFIIGFSASEVRPSYGWALHVSNIGVTDRRLDAENQSPRIGCSGYKLHLARPPSHSSRTNTFVIFSTSPLNPRRSSSSPSMSLDVPRSRIRSIPYAIPHVSGCLGLNLFLTPLRASSANVERLSYPMM